MQISKKVYAEVWAKIEREEGRPQSNAEDKRQKRKIEKKAVIDFCLSLKKDSHVHWSKEINSQHVEN